MFTLKNIIPLGGPDTPRNLRYDASKAIFEHLGKLGYDPRNESEDYENGPDVVVAEDDGWRPRIEIGRDGLVCVSTVFWFDPLTDEKRIEIANAVNQSNANSRLLRWSYEPRSDASGEYTAVFAEFTAHTWTDIASFQNSFDLYRGELERVLAYVEDGFGTGAGEFDGPEAPPAPTSEK